MNAPPLCVKASPPSTHLAFNSRFAFTSLRQHKKKLKQVLHRETLNNVEQRHGMQRGDGDVQLGEVGAAVSGVGGRRAPSHTESPHAELQDGDDSKTARKHTTTNLIMHIGRQPCTYTATVEGGGVGGGGVGWAQCGGGRGLLTSSVISLMYKSSFFFSFSLFQKQNDMIRLLQVLCGVRADETQSDQSSPIRSDKISEMIFV